MTLLRSCRLLAVMQLAYAVLCGPAFAGDCPASTPAGNIRAGNALKSAYDQANMLYGKIEENLKAHDDPDYKEAVKKALDLLQSSKEDWLEFQDKDVEFMTYACRGNKAAEDTLKAQLTTDHFTMLCALYGGISDEEVQGCPKNEAETPEQENALFTKY